MHSGVYIISVFLLLSKSGTWGQTPVLPSRTWGQTPVLGAIAPNDWIAAGVPKELVENVSPSVLLKYPHYYNLLYMAVNGVNNCYEDEDNTVIVPITISGFVNMLHSTTEPPRNTKCLRYCIMRNNHLFADNNQLTRNEWSVFLRQLYNNRISDTQSLQIADICKNSTVAMTDRCERGHVGAMCIIDNMHKLGFLDV